METNPVPAWKCPQAVLGSFGGVVDRGTVACTFCTLLLNTPLVFPVSREHERGSAGDRDLAGDVLGDQLCHLEHRHLLLAAKDSLELVIGVDVALVLGVLEPVLLDVNPETLGELTA